MLIDLKKLNCSYNLVLKIHLKWNQMYYKIPQFALENIMYLKFVNCEYREEGKKKRLWF